MISMRRNVVALLLSAVVLAAACGQERVESGEAPGFSGQQRTVDRTPFQLAVPKDGGGPTTSPSQPTLSLPDNIAVTTGQGNQAPSSRSTTTTTTTPDVRPVIRRAGEITDLCGLTRAITSGGTLLREPTLDVVSTHNEIKASLDRFVVVSPPEWLGRVTLVRDVIFRIADAAAAAGYDVRDPGVQQLVDDVANGRGEYRRFLDVVDEIYQLERSACT